MIELDFEKQGGLVPVITQDAASGEVLMQAYMNREAWEKTLTSGLAHYWSRTRGALWKKGGISGNIQEVKEIRVDCDADCVLLKVTQKGGAACHTGYRSCFYRKVKGGALIEDGEKVFDPGDVYT
ncbi:MAG: phosphoribosyl-AMP cyclohydrolase [Spirochaetales bacterium]|nr:phosphoribosyl-AMP cyclohydrolase [Spirochaetales bacterium]